MPRSSSNSRGSSSPPKSGGFFSRGSQPAAARPAAAAPHPPAHAPPAQAPMQSSGGGMMSGIGGTIVQGMAFGAGSEVAHQAVRSIMGGGSGHGV